MADILSRLTSGGLLVGAAAVAGMWGAGKLLDAIETPARSLSWSEAMSLVEQAANAGKIHIVKRQGRMVGITPEVDGVALRYWNGSQGVARGVEYIDPRLLVLLLRFVAWDQNLVEIDHAGIFPGHNAEDGEETHNRGTAIDFSRFVYDDGSVLDVLRDWGMVRAWTGQYRLHSGDKGAGHFSDIFDFLAGQATDRPTDGCGFSGDNQSSTATLGDRSFLITPDHGSKGLAADHKNHIHAQVGPTRSCAGRSARNW